MKVGRVVAAAIVVAGLSACGGDPPRNAVPPYDEYEPEMVYAPPALPIIESTPIEPVEPPDPPAQAPTPTPLPIQPQTLSQTLMQTTTPQIALAPPTTLAPTIGVPPVPKPAPPATEPTEDQQMLVLLADLTRYGTLAPDEVKREIVLGTQALTRQRTDANRVRLAVLYTLSRTTQDDQRALQLFDNVAKSSPAPVTIKQLAAVLEAQVSERQRAVREEQQKAAETSRKLEALREMERALLRDRVRSGGGGGGGGGGGSGGH
jgi:hypothetical protein